MSKSNPITLITGANGAVGFPIVVHALREGHTVRAVVRSQAKADLISSAESIKALPETAQSRLTFALIPDILAPSAYEEVIKDITYGIHVASPIPSASLPPDEFEVNLIQPALKGTLNFVEAAEKAGVKRVVITSSIGAILPVGKSGLEEEVFNETSRVEDPSGPYSDQFAAYLASKITALNATERWVKNDGKGRNTEVVYVMPSYVLGRVELAKTKQELLGGSSGLPLAMMLADEPTVQSLAGTTVWNEDVAQAHLRALDDTRVPNGQSLIVSSDAVAGIKWKDSKAILEKAFPEAVKKGILPNNGWPESSVVNIDVSESEKLLNMRFVGYETQLLAVAGQYLESIGEAKA